MLQNAYFLAKIGADTAENEQHFAEILPGARTALREGGADRSAKFRQNVARFRLNRHRFLQENMRLTAFFKIYQIITLKFLKYGKICKFCDICKIFAEFSRKIADFSNRFFAKILRLQRCKNMQIL